MAETAITPPEEKKNRNIAGILFLLAVGMVGAAYAAVPLYYAFCAVTGYGGTTRVATGNAKGVIAREMTVRFDTSMSGEIPWQVTPPRAITGKVGSVETVTFIARNLANHAVTGRAVFNVVPELSGQYFNKIQCFCFSNQTLKAGETAEMPVTFFVDPDIDKDSDLKTLHDITLSYTFYAEPTKGS
jgi:cytochrome c oxidase assembly protein subunit 11